MPLRHQFTNPRVDLPGEHCMDRVHSDSGCRFDRKAAPWPPHVNLLPVRYARSLADATGTGPPPSDRATNDDGRVDVGRSVVRGMNTRVGVPATNIFRSLSRHPQQALLLALLVIAITGLACDRQPSAVPIEGQRASPSPSADGGPITVSTDETSQRCSARSAPTSISVDMKVPLEVEETIRAIASATWRCDWQLLEGLALSGHPEFGYGTGFRNDPAGYWRTFDPCDRNARHLLRLLDGEGTDVPARDYHRIFKDEDMTLYLWPAEAEVPFDDPRNSYFGFRLGILEDGDWLFFVKGSFRYEGCSRK